MKSIVKNPIVAGTILAIAGMMGTNSLQGADPHAHATKAKPYTLDACVVSGEKLGSMGDPYVFVHEGQEIKLCCKGCLKKFNADPAPYLKKIAAVKAYPLETCLVSGEKLGEMGEPYVFVHKDQQIKLCCKGCLKKFEKETAVYLKKLAEAAKAHKH